VLLVIFQKKITKSQEKNNNNNEEEEGSVSYTIEHSFTSGNSNSNSNSNSDSDQFTPRGSVELKYSSRLSVLMSDYTFNSQEISLFKKLIEQNGFYRIRLVPKNNNNNNNQNINGVMASVPACSLSESGYREMMQF